MMHYADSDPHIIRYTCHTVYTAWVSWGALKYGEGSYVMVNFVLIC